MKYLQTILVLLIVSLCQGQQTFPKIWWVYWQQGYQNAPSFIQLNIKNYQKYAIKNGWQMKYLSNSNLNEYIDQNELNRRINLAYNKSLQLKSDILRIMILYKYGGLWIDANCVLLRDVSWLNAINVDIYIHNQLSSQPQILISANTSKTNEGQILSFNSKSINIFPGFQNWFILAKPNALYFQDALQILEEILTNSKQNIDQALLKQGVIIQKQHLNPQLISSDYLFQIILLRKQKQIGLNDKQYAVEHYNIWHFQAHETVYQYATKNKLYTHQMWADLITQNYTPIQSFYYYFWKVQDHHYLQFSQYLNQYSQLNCWGADLLIQDKSHIQKYLLNIPEDNIANPIHEMLENKLNANYCKSLIDKKYEMQNNQTFINLIIQGGFMVVLLGLLFCTLLVVCINQRLAEQKFLQKA